MTSIVVGVDGSESAQRALQWAVEEGRLRRATVEAVHVWELPVLVGTPFGTVPVEVDADVAGAQAALDAVVDAVDESGLAAPIVRTVTAGSPANRILEIADENGAALIVLGSRGRGGFAELLLGSVSQQVSHHARCPVVIVPHDR
jgi:nucleotide-binding universal stress UspA family protein